MIHFLLFRYVSVHIYIFLQLMAKTQRKFLRREDFFSLLLAKPSCESQHLRRKEVHKIASTKDAEM